jgi:hypothetical protein
MPSLPTLSAEASVYAGSTSEAAQVISGGHGVPLGRSTPTKPAEMGERPLGLAVWRIDIGDAWRIGPAPRIITGIGEELAGLGSSAARIKHELRGLVGHRNGIC